MICSIPVEPLAILLIIDQFPNSCQTLAVHLSTKISIGTEMVFSQNLDKISKIDILMGYRFVEDFLLNPICKLYITVCLYMLFSVQSIQIKYV